LVATFDERAAFGVSTQVPDDADGHEHAKVVHRLETRREVFHVVTDAVQVRFPGVILDIGFPAHIHA